MRTQPTSRSVALACLLALAMLGGCAHRTPPLYTWGSYQPQVYAYLKAESSSPEDQLLALQEGEQEAQADNLKLPPGYHAQMGLLYLNTGHADKALEEWQKEKALFPESTTYIDFLIHNMKQNGV